MINDVIIHEEELNILLQFEEVTIPLNKNNQFIRIILKRKDKNKNGIIGKR